MRQQISLNYKWMYIDSFEENYLNNLEIPGQSEIMIPHTMKEVPYNYFNELDYQFVGTYSRIIQIEKVMKNSIIILDFAGVMNVCKVYLNGELLMTHEGGYTPFKVNITDRSIIGDNLLQLVVNSAEVKNIPPHGHFVDYLSFSGVYREISLNILPKTHITQIHVSTSEDIGLHENDMMVIVDLVLEQEQTFEYDVNAIILFNNKEIYQSKFETKLVDKQSYFASLKNIKRWDIDNPYLYTIKLQILTDAKLVDEISTRFGFRTVRFTPEGFSLNNKPLKLLGLNRHQSYPYVGYAMPKRIQESDAEILKDFGCNIVRTSHYMQSNHFLNRCDEIGLLVLEEIPGWNYIGNEHFKELTYQNLETMINEHFNHPSIVTWGVRINESIDDHKFYSKTNELAHNLDSTRQTCGIRNTKKGEFLEDIYTYNDFSHIGNNQGLESPNKVTKGYISYLVTEHNGHVFPTKKFDPEVTRIEQAMRHTNVIDSAFKYNRISGAIGWCLADYNTHVQFGSNDRICYHGVMDMFRIPKYAAYAYKAQKEDEPVLFIASNLIPGDFQEFKLAETIIFTNCNYVKVYKNDEFIGDYYSEWKTYSNIPNAPIIIDDLIGNLIINNEDYSNKQAKLITKLLLSFNHHGFNLPLKDKLIYLKLTWSKVVDMSILTYLYEKYIANQGYEPTVYKFEGYINDKLVITKKKGQSVKFKLISKADSLELEHGFTYDATRVVVELQDEYENILTYSNEPIEISTSEHLEVIGPQNLALIGGSIGFYVKTTGILGKSWIKIKSNNYPDILLEIKIK